jgi:hypothetical protein
MSEKIRLSLDRRSGEDRRKAYRVGYFLQGGIERRSGNERRRQHERRKAWMRISGWSSMRKDLLGADFGLDNERGEGQKTF